MKKLSLYIFLVLMWCNVGFAKPVLLECTDNEPLDPNLDTYRYWSLDLEKKSFYSEGIIEIVKGDCALGDCKKITKFHDKIPFRKESAEFLYLGHDNIPNKMGHDVFDHYTFNKGNLTLVNYYNNIYDVDLKKRYSYQDISSCKTINKFPFK